MNFTERLQKAAEHAGVRWTQTEVARSLTVSRQTVFQWFHGTVPEFPMIAHIARTWRIDPSWLGGGVGDMTGSANVVGLSSEEKDIVKFYRNAPPARRKALYDMAKALSKSVVVMALTIPALIPQRVEAAFNITKFGINTHWLRFLRSILAYRPISCW
jgi:transcriptional regulator with XRE-family HTH domain